MSWRRAVTLALVAPLLIGACGGGRDELRWDAPDVDPDEIRAQARDVGMTAACENGTFDRATELSGACEDRDGVLGWLYPFAECVDGSYIVLAGNPEPSCDEQDGFRRVVDEPVPAADDVALCADGLFDDEIELGENCQDQGGVARFLATYAECINGRVILMTDDGIACDEGIARLLPDDYVPEPGPDDVALCNDGLFDNEIDLEDNCKKQGGIAGFLAAYAECADGEIVEMTEEAGCDGGMSLLSDAYVPPSTTTTISPATTPEPASACIVISDEALADTIGLGLTVDGGGYLADGQAVVVSPESQLSAGWPMLFVSATIRGAGLGDDTIGTWAVGFNDETQTIAGPIVALDAFAREFSDWGSAAGSGSRAEDNINYLRGTNEARLAEDCVGS